MKLSKIKAQLGYSISGHSEIQEKISDIINTFLALIFFQILTSGCALHLEVLRFSPPRLEFIQKERP